MPLFFYHCTQCDAEFEALVMGSEQPVCSPEHRRMKAFGAS